MLPPVAKKIDFELINHNNKRVDPYYWLCERDNPEVINYLKAENKYTAEVLKPQSELIDKLYDEIVGRIKKDDESVPYLKNGYFYQTRYNGNAEYPIYSRWKADAPKNVEILFDINKLAKGHAFFSDSYHNISPDNKIAAIGIDTVSRRNYTIKFKDLTTGEFLKDNIPMTSGSVAWSADSRAVYYTLRDKATLRSYKIMKHLIGSKVEDDKIIFEESDNAFVVSVHNCKDKDVIMIHSESTMATEVRILDSRIGGDDFVVVEPRKQGHEYYANVVNGKLFVRTNLGALNFKVVVADVKTPHKNSWKEILPHSSSVLVEQIEPFEKFLVVGERFNGLNRFRVISLNTLNSQFIAIDEEAYVLDNAPNHMADALCFRYIYSSLTTPRSVVEYNFTTGKSKVLKEAEVLGGYDKANYEAKRVFATAKDGVKIPISLVYRKELTHDGRHPALLYAYGSYGYSTDPWFRSSIISLLDRGFIFAIAHVRGGEEMGREWYEDGKLLNKMNTFTDFIACSEYLIAEKYTNPGRLFASGGSAGGLLMGVVANLRPGLYKGIIANVPFVDVVTTMLDESIPLTTGEYNEWGNPNDKTFYDYMLSYSPYDNVKPANYCNIFVTAGYHDSQVQYWEPAKWVAKLRANNTGNSLILLRTEMNYGHGGASGRFEAYREIAIEYAFMLKVL